jgi:DNA processing protein
MTATPQRRHSDPSPQLDDAAAAYASALAALGLSPGRLRSLVAGISPQAAWEALGAGCHPADVRGELRAKVTDGVLESAFRFGSGSSVAVHVLGRSGYPSSLAADPDPPAVLFSLGDLGCLDKRPRVAIVGTRNATPTGLVVAEELGSALGAAGVVVVSGLARGIDTAAHRGLLSRPAAAPPVGVLGTAIDAHMAPDQASLCRDVAQSGLLLSELPPGAVGARWWFAVRNRVMAALAHLVVVVECHATGGALHTVAAAKRRSTAVAVVPGSVRSPASTGTNALLVKGAAPVRHAEDVLELLVEVIGSRTEVAWPTKPAIPTSAARRPGPCGNPLARVVRRALDHNPVSLDTLVLRTGLPLGEVSLALEDLVDGGLAVGEHGWWSLPVR